VCAFGNDSTLNIGLVGLQKFIVVLTRISVCVWNRQYVKNGLVGLQNDTVMLVCVSVSVWN
jgi:hypothetical protein